ncbi:MAG: G-D-S-L family lipolytic protein [Scytonematopsis contorta HA4267-MV1]|jgi:lysophospholipase L1-like esterase|nr:G-D-S-L family lipolytic protein [Scytonematopsis contorta HA4267-MV1]
MQTFEPPSSMQLSSVKNRCQPLKIVALGDSLVYGFGDPEGGGWVERLRRWWMSPDNAGHVLYNLGVRGDRTSQVAKRLEIEFRHRGELRNRVPDAILLSVGVNDSARVGRPNGKNYTDFAAFEREIASLLDQAQQLCPVLFIGMMPVDEAKMPFLDCLYYNHADQYRYKEATKIACSKRGIPYLDIFDKWIERDPAWRLKRVSSDGLHPNTLGYQTLLEEAIHWEAMQSYF